MLCNMNAILHVRNGSYLLDLFLFVMSVCNIDWEEFFFKRNLILFLQFFLLDKEEYIEISSVFYGRVILVLSFFFFFFFLQDHHNQKHCPLNTS